MLLLIVTAKTHCYWLLWLLKHSEGKLLFLQGFHLIAITIITEHFFLLGHSAYLIDIFHNGDQI